MWENEDSTGHMSNSRPNVSVFKNNPMCYPSLICADIKVRKYQIVKLKEVKSKTMVSRGWSRGEGKGKLELLIKGDKAPVCMMYTFYRLLQNTVPTDITVLYT